MACCENAGTAANQPACCTAETGGQRASAVRAGIFISAVLQALLRRLHAWRFMRLRRDRHTVEVHGPATSPDTL